MTKEQISIGDFNHIYNRGSRRMPIVYDEADKWRFLKILRYLNDEYAPINIFRQIEFEIKSGKCRNFDRPKNWPSPRPLVKILSYGLMPNHFHLLLKQITENGISKFMSRVGNSLTKYINTRHKTSGRIFQGAYQAKLISDEKYFQYVDTYVQVFNIFELYSGGLERAMKEFDKAFEFVLEYPFCSLGESFDKRKLNIVDRDTLGETFRNLQEYKEFAREALVSHDIRQDFKDYIID